MIDRICDMLMSRVRLKMPDIDEERAEVIRYGFELIIGEIPKMIFTIFIAIILGKIKMFFLSFIVICPYRIFSGGVHLKSHIGCFITTNLLYLGTVYFCEWFRFYTYIYKIIISLVIYFFSFVMIILYAPADTEMVPILIKKDRTICKIKSILWVTFVMAISTIIKDETTSNLCIFGVLFQTVTITKLSYKLLGLKLGYMEYKESL